MTLPKISQKLKGRVFFSGNKRKNEKGENR